MSNTICLGYTETMGPKTSGTSATIQPRGTSSDLAEGEGDPLSNQSNNNIVTPVDTPANTEDTTALKQRTITMALKVMRSEERNIFFGELIEAGLGTKEVENFISNQEYLRREEGLGGLGGP